MSHHLLNLDHRTRGSGGWAYFEHEAIDAFTPLIGPLGTMVYLSMCRLIPLACLNSDRPVTASRVSEFSCVKRSMAAEKMKEIVALGMVIEIPNEIRNRPSAYQLVPLRELTQVGIPELERRLCAHLGWEEFRRRLIDRLGGAGMKGRFGVHWVDTTEEDVFPGGCARPLANAPHSGLGRALAGDEANKVEEAAAARPAGLGVSGVHGVDTDEEAGGAEREVADSGQSVSTTGASVSTRKASVSARRASVSTQSGHPLTKEEEVEEERDKEPPTPASGGMAADGLALPVECHAGHPEFAHYLAMAAGWVRRKCGIANSRKDRIIAAALELRSETTGESLDPLARLMAQRFQEYEQEEADGVLRYHEGVDKFFGNGTCWRPGSWPRDRAAEDRRSAAAVGAYRPAEVETDVRRRYLERNAAAIAATGLVPEIAAALLDLAPEADAADYAELDGKLQALEDQMSAQVLRTADVAELRELRRRVSLDMRPFASRLPLPKLQEAEDRKVESELLRARKLPRLSLFYMGR